MGVNASNTFPVTDEITRSTLRSLRYSITGAPTLSGSGVGIGVDDGKVGCGVDGIGVGVGGAGVAVGEEQAVRITPRHRPTIKMRRRFCMRTSPFLKHIHLIQGVGSRS